MPHHLLSALPIVAVAATCALGLAAPPAENATASAYDPAESFYKDAPPREVTIRDERRSRDVLLTVRTPADNQGPFPLIIFSHGAGGSGDAFEHLSATLARRGYVVVHPWHSDSVALARRNGEPGFDPALGLDQLVSRVNIPDRLADVRFIINSADEIAEALGDENLIDAGRVGLAGHSAGAMTTQAAAGARFTPQRRARPGRAISMPIEAIAAFAVISGQGTTTPAFNEESWLECRRPMLVVAGSRDTTPISNETPESRRHPFEFAPADGSKFLLYITGATHDSYQGSRNARVLREEKPENADWIERVTTLSVVALMDAYVRGDGAAADWLKAGAAREIPGGELEWSSK